MDKTNAIGTLLHYLAFSLDRQSDQILQERFGIGLSQQKILRVVCLHQGVSQRFVADFLGQSEASVSRQVGLMLEDGLIYRGVSKADRRQHVLLPTSKDSRVLEVAEGALNQLHHTVVQCLSAKQQLQLRSMLKSMNQQARQIG
ncbi:MAG: MarR family winged helix-turn-helix transcriptional regulator [Candidatus Saccharibacteria bacterium]|nr:MarR family winged helix-turn-helix transcriptional regulator [Candidatus Saccharibacteria bacterium]